VYSLIKGQVGKRVVALFCACAFGLFAAGCHNNTQDSGFGVAWVTLTDEPGDFTSYIITVDSVILQGKVNGLITAVAVPEVVDFTKLVKFSELWSSASIPVDTYLNATITLDYSVAQISVLGADGTPIRANVVDAATGLAPAVITVNVTLDPNNQLIVPLTFATTAALRLAFDFDLAGSNTVDMSTTPPTVAIKPFFSVSTAASDSKLIRVRGPLINSSNTVGTYTVVVRPFFDEVNTLGTMTIFNSPNTIYTLNGVGYVGPPGLQALSKTSAGSTMTAAWTTFQPTATPTAGITAGIFSSNYIVAGSSLEDFYTFGLEGDVIARNGNVLTVRGGTLFANVDQLVQYLNIDSLVIVGPPTIVTADGTTNLGPLNYNSISVGQHITARGIYSLSAANVVTLDSTGASATNTGSVRLQSTELFGASTSFASGSLLLNLQAFNDWPVSNYIFAGNGSSPALDPTAANYLVNSGALTLPAGPTGVPVAPGDPLWIDGFTSPFGTAPPDFIAESISAEPTVPATMIARWDLGTTAPFSSLTDSGLTIDLANAAFDSGEIRIGAEVIDITTLGATPQVIPQPLPAPVAGLPPIFLPVFSLGNPVGGVFSFNGYAEYVTRLNATFATPLPTFKFTASGVYNRATNIFTASTINVIL
jgi:hypothetical protein